MLYKTKNRNRINLISFFFFFMSVVTTCNATIVFLHIPKTGGTTVSVLLKKNFNKSEIYPFPKIGRGRAITRNLEEMKSALNELPPITHKLIWGHFPMWFLQNKDPGYDSTSYYFTVLRDPVQRILSKDRDDLREGRISCSNPLRNAPNVMCRMLSLDPTLEGEALLEDAINGLERMNYIIFMDDFEAGIREVFEHLGLHLTKVPHTNSTSNIKQTINDTLINQIKEKHSLDIRLYQYAINKYR